MSSRFMWLPLWLENILWFQDFSWQVPCLTQSWPTRHHAAVLQGSKCHRDPLPANRADCDVIADRLPVPACPKSIQEGWRSKLLRCTLQTSQMIYPRHVLSKMFQTRQTQHSRSNHLTSAETLGGPTSSHPARPVKPWWDFLPAARLQEFPKMEWFNVSNDRNGVKLLHIVVLLVLFYKVAMRIYMIIYIYIYIYIYFIYIYNHHIALTQLYQRIQCICHECWMHLQLWLVPASGGS